MMFLVDWKEKKNMFKKLQDYQGTAQCQLAKLLHLFERSWHAPNHHPTLVCAKTQSFANEPQGQVVTASGWLINRQICQRLEIEENVSEACKHVVFTLIGRKCLIFSNHIASLPGHWLALGAEHIWASKQLLVSAGSGSAAVLMSFLTRLCFCHRIHTLCALDVSMWSMCVRGA